jgi:hypothetical protein
MTARGAGEYALGDAGIRQVGAAWIAIVAKVQLEGAVRDPRGSLASGRKRWTDLHEVERKEGWKRLGRGG